MKIQKPNLCGVYNEIKKNNDSEWNVYRILDFQLSLYLKLVDVDEVKNF